MANAKPMALLVSSLLSGYTTVVVDYRLGPANVFPDYVLDTASAMGWVYRNIAQYGGNPNQLFVMGHSGGV